MLVAGIIPSLAWGLATGFALRSVLAVSLTPLESLLERTHAELQEHRRDPVLTQDLAQARLYLAEAELGRRALVRQLPYGFLLLVLTSAAVSAIAAVLIGRRLSRPIEQLTQAVIHYAQGDLLYRIPDRPARRPDELQFLIHQFNQMGTELETQRERLWVTEKLAAWQGESSAAARDQLLYWAELVVSV
jgi:nitrogen fixation/metabolism regulation signal transduction histidine kinase